MTCFVAVSLPIFPHLIVINSSYLIFYLRFLQIIMIFSFILLLSLRLTLYYPMLAFSKSENKYLSLNHGYDHHGIKKKNKIICLRWRLRPNPQLKVLNSDKVFVEKFWFSYPYILGTLCLRPLIFHPGCKNIGNVKSNFVAKIQFLYHILVIYIDLLIDWFCSCMFVFSLALHST